MKVAGTKTDVPVRCERPTTASSGRSSRFALGAPLKLGVRFPPNMMNIQDFKDILALIKKGATIEAEEKIMQLRAAALELQEENLNLKTKLQDAEQRIRELESFAGDPCPKCRAPAWVIESSEPDKTFGDLGGIRRHYKCKECGYSESPLVTPK